MIIPSGSGCVNYLFLDKECYVVEINANLLNSWGLKFGLSDIPKKVFYYVSMNTKDSGSKCEIDVQRMHDFHIRWDKKIEIFIQKKINLS